MSLNICKLCKRPLRDISTCTIENCVQGFNPLVLKKEMIDKFLYNFFSSIDNFFEALDKLFKRLHNRCHERYKNIRKLFKKSKRRKSKKTSF